MPSLHERIGLHDQSMLCVSRSDSEIEVEAETSCFDPKNESYKQPNITVILPSGCHGRPLGIDSKGPPPLIKRWKEGGKCDCKGWDLGCGMMVLSDQQPKTSQGMESSSSLRLGSHKNDGKQLVLYKQVEPPYHFLNLFMFFFSFFFCFSFSNGTRRQSDFKNPDMWFTWQVP